MLGLNNKLKELEKQGKSINIALTGIGQMGTGIVSHLKNIKAFNILAISCRNIEKAVIKMQDLGYGKNDIYIINKIACDADKNNEIKIPLFKEGAQNGADNNLCTGIPEPFNCYEKEIEKALGSKRIIITDDMALISFIEKVDVIVDATGSPEAGAQIALYGIINNKHVVTLNVEADTAVGPLLKKIADTKNVVYTVAAGDEPAALKELYDFASALNLEVVAAGKGKNNPLDRDSNPTTLEEYSKLKGTNASMMTSFVDGTKSMLEMACFSNATGIIPDCRGMHAPAANVKDLTSIFSLKKDGGILDKKGIVDFAVGNVAPGVFLVYTTKQKVIQEELKYLLFGDGPNYLLYRPFHLASIEAPLSIARAYIYNEPTIVSANGLVSEVLTVAKKDLNTGDVLDGIGGYKTYGLIDLYETAKAQDFLPLGLSEGAVLKRTIKKGEVIKNSDARLCSDSVIFKLRKLQEKIIS